MGKKKVNPRRIPATMETVNKARDESIHLAMAIFLNVLKDMGHDNETIKFVWDRVDKLSREVADGRVNLWDFVQVLYDEYGIDLR